MRTWSDSITEKGNRVNLLVALVFIWVLLPLTGCSVAMALSGKKDPNLGVIHEGSTRGEVELQLGPPISSVTMEDGRRMDIYEYTIGNEPSAGRAVAHGVLDVLTWGLWEVVGTPVEGLKGNKYQLTIYYDSKNRVMSLNQVPEMATAKKDDTGVIKPRKQETEQKPEARIIKTETEDKLDQIKALKDKGKINEEEYALMRKEILNIGKAKASDPAEKIPTASLPY